MRKLLSILVVILIFISMNAFAQTPGTDTVNVYKCKSSGLKSASGVIKNDVASICGFTIHPDGTNACTVVLYDNKSAGSGTELAKFVAAAGEGSTSGQVQPFLINAQNGIYASITTLGTCGIIVWFRE